MNLRELRFAIAFDQFEGAVHDALAIRGGWMEYGKRIEFWDRRVNLFEPTETDTERALGGDDLADATAHPPAPTRERLA